MAGCMGKPPAYSTLSMKTRMIFIAVEHFRPEGPFAILPMNDLPDGNHISSIVWTVEDGGFNPANAAPDVVNGGPAIPRAAAMGR